VQNNPVGTECAGVHKTALIEIYENTNPEKTRKQANTAVENMSLKMRPIMRPDRTNRAYVAGSIGDTTRRSDQHTRMEAHNKKKKDASKRANAISLETNPELR
jgi:HD superfamily phosphohydrolase YqeK